MLTAEAAAEQLKPWLLTVTAEHPTPPVIKDIAKLPARLRTIGYALFGFDENGKEVVAEDWSKHQRRVNSALQPLDDLSQKERRTLFATLFQRWAETVEATWELLKHAPCRSSYPRRAFRAPQRPEATFDVRKSWLASFATGWARVRPEVITPPWLAIWGAHLNALDDEDLGRFLAAAINRDDATGREVFEILCQSVRNEHEIAGMSRMAVRALLISDRTEGWSLIERLLLAAQRQEGLRQVILEAVDVAHPQAFRRMLKIIQDAKLARFSAVTRAVDVWCGLNYESDQVKSVNEAIARVLRFLEDPSKPAAALTANDPEDVYFALWTMAYEDADAAIQAAEKPARHKKPEVRYVTANLLVQLGLPETLPILNVMLSDDDLRIALMALDGVQTLELSDGSAEQQQRFERIEQLYQRLPEKPQKLPAIVWPWTERSADRASVAGALYELLGELPPTRLLPYLPTMQRYYRSAIVRKLAQQQKWDPLTRETLLELTGSTSPDVREAAIEALARVELMEPEIRFIEGLLSRKASDLRIGALKLLTGQTDAEAIASADRLLNSKDPLSRLGGLELLRTLLDADRDRKTCQDRARVFADSSTKKTKDEFAQLETILQAPTVRITLENALGLLNPAELSAIPNVTARPVQFYTDATLEIVKSLDALLHEHREEPIKYTNWAGTEVEELLGTTYGFPRPEWDKPPETQLPRLPLAAVWEEWYQQRPSSLRDPDGLEFVRVHLFLKTLGGYWWNNVLAWAAQHPDRQAWISAISSGKQPLEIKYERVLDDVIHWLIFLHRPAGVEDFLLDAAETWMALVPQCCQEDLVHFATAGETPSEYAPSGNERIDWRIQYGNHEWYSAVSDARLNREETPERFARRWKLACYFNQPVPGALRNRPGLEMTLQAYRAGLASLADLTDTFLGPRESGWHASFSELSQVTSHQVPNDLKKLFADLPEVTALIERCRERVLEIELARADTPTPATGAAQSLGCLGVKTLGRILRVIGANGFKITNRYSSDAKLARLPTLTTLARQTFPRKDDTQADFDREMKTCLAAGLREQTVLELMFLAPQWTKFVENYFRWSGLSEGLYWFLAHMKYINSDAESAATASGYEADKAEEGKDNSQNQSAWDRLIAERTSLTDEERTHGAIDVDWFHKVYAQLTPKRWEALAAAARFAANPAQARRATYLGEVLLGTANRKDLFAQVTQKKLKDAVRLIGLYPLAGGAKSATDLAQRYKMLVDYRRYAKQLSSLTKPAAMQALEIGFRNLASTAGYTDPLRLEWAMEADAVKDLAQGAVSATKDGVTVTLSLDDLARPVIITEKNGKPLKSVPPAVKKDKRIAEILDRVADLRRQAARVKESLEAAMCRGDEFSPDELAKLCQHALLRPLLLRLVIVAEDRAGYPDKGGKSLRDHTGKQQTILKKSKLRVAHPVDLYERGDWSNWQHECFQQNRVQPFKQIFRELYLVTKQERKDRTKSLRYAGQQVNPQQAKALWNARHWHSQDDVFKAFPAEGVTASVSFRFGGFTPLDVEGLTFEAISFAKRDQIKPLTLAEVPPRLFSEVMRDLDLVVSVAHRGGVDPEATASTVEMREVLVRETCSLLGLTNVKIKQPRVVIKGQLAEYAVHLGSGNVHRMPGSALCIIPVHAQHRGRLFLPFADDDPRTAEIVSKVLLLAKDHEIQDPSILEQLRR